MTTKFSDAEIANLLESIRLDEATIERYRVAMESAVEKLTTPSEFPMLQAQLAMQELVKALEGK